MRQAQVAVEDAARIGADATAEGPLLGADGERPSAREAVLQTRGA